MEDTGRKQTKHNTAQHNATQKTKTISNTDPTKNQDELICSQRESSPPWLDIRHETHIDKSCRKQLFTTHFTSQWHIVVHAGLILHGCN